MTLALRKILALALLVSFTANCGRKKEDDDEDQPAAEETPAPVVQPTSTTSTSSSGGTNASVATSSPSPAPTVAPLPEATIWVASNTLRGIAGYRSDGTPLGVFIDLSSQGTGFVTSLTFLSRNILLATFDPGAAGEKVIRINLNEDTVSSINSNWFQDGTNLNNVMLYNLVKWSDSKLIAIKNATSLEAINYSLPMNIAMRLGAPFISTGLTGAATCTITTINQVATLVLSGVNNTKKLLVATSGTAPRLNLYDGIDGVRTCAASFNVVAGPITAAHVPTGIVQLADRKIYVRYQSATVPAIVRYDYDGTNFTNQTSVFTDTAVLNTSLTDREMVAFDDTTLLFSNWATDAVYKLDTTTGLADPLIRDSFTVDVNAIAVRPRS